MKHIAVIGGGVAGTAAAYTLVNLGYKVTIIEQGDRLGGRVHSVEAHGTTFEMGAGFMTNAYANMLAFVEKEGLQHKLYKQRGHSGVLRGNKVKMATLPDLAGNAGLSLGAKMQALPLLASVLKNWRRLDMHAPWKAASLDTQTVSEIFRGTAGREFLEYVIQPILNGYFYWTPEQTSRAMLLIICKALVQGGTYKLKGGLQQIPERAAIESRVLLDHEVTLVERQPNDVYKITVKAGDKTSELVADGVVCATTASVVPKILPNLTVEQKRFFSSIAYSSTAVVAQVFKRSDTKGDKGIALPRKEGSRLAAVTVSPEPSSGSDPMSTVKMYASGLYGAGLAKQNDEALVAAVTDDFTKVRSSMLLPEALALTTQTQRWPEALPVFDVGHFKKLQSFANGEVEKKDRLVFAGDYLGGPFMEGAFTSGMQAAERLHAQI